MKIVYKWLIGMVVVLGLAACDEKINPDIDDILSSDGAPDSAGDALQITDISFSDDHKYETLTARLAHETGDYDLMDSTRVVVKPSQQIQLLPGKFGEEIPPIITKITNPGRDVLKKKGIKMLMLVDLSLPQKEIDAEQSAVREARALFGHQGIYVAFMQGDNVSQTYEATDYIVDNYFVHRDPSYIYLYRSVYTKLSEFSNDSTTIGSARHKVLVVLSGGKTYDNDMPVDPQHFALQQQLADMVPMLKGKLWFYYVNFSPMMSGGDEFFAMSDNPSSSNILNYLCADLNGLYQSSFNWLEMETDILNDFKIDPAQFFITLENPDGKVFRGMLHKLQIGFYDRKTNDMIAKGSITYSLGTIFSPVIVNDDSMLQIVLGGIFTTLFVLLILWVVLQFVEPYIRYLIFKKKHVIRYSGNKMSYKGLEVAESCYLCKAPFDLGDEIVVKCKHTVHKTCWDENEYHCPEHGRHCKEGAHYYNQHNLFDNDNKLFSAKWMLLAVVAGFAAWLWFISEDHSAYAGIIQYIHNLYHEVTATSDKNGELTFVYGAYLNDLPAFGQAVGFMLTFFFSYFTVRRRMWLFRLGEMLLRAVLAALAGWLCCMLGCIVSIIMHMDSATFLIDWIPWLLLSGVIFIAVTINTRTPIRRAFILESFCIAILAVLVWGFVFYNTMLSYRLSLLAGFIVYAVSISVCIAKETPRSERYFLHVEGAIKEMDIALYKWMRNSTDPVVTIGKSVDCSIQLSWDINGKAAPVQAEIRKYKRSMRLTALEEGVYVDNKPLAPEQVIWLYHGRKFTIGNTTFTYVEKDLS